MPEPSRRAGKFESVQLLVSWPPPLCFDYNVVAQRREHIPLHSHTWCSSAAHLVSASRRTVTISGQPNARAMMAGEHRVRVPAAHRHQTAQTHRHADGNAGCRRMSDGNAGFSENGGSAVLSLHHGGLSSAAQQSGN